METPRSIFHLDADAFFVSVEQACDPSLKGKAVAVGGTKRGVISSASYEARAKGVKSAMPTVQALRLCPELIMVSGNYRRYEEYSQKMFSYLYDYTPHVEIGSIDEGYADFTPQTKLPAAEIAKKIQQAIHQTLKITVSVGLSTNKLVSQIASKKNKPGGFVIVPPGEEKDFLAPLGVGWLPGVGPKTQKSLEEVGLKTIDQIAQMPLEKLSRLIGTRGDWLQAMALGIDTRPVESVSSEAKSYGEQETFDEDTFDEDWVLAKLKSMADHLFLKIRHERKSVRTLTVKVRYHDMSQAQRSYSLKEPTDLETDVYDVLGRILRHAWEKKTSLRLVGLQLSNLYDSFFREELALPPGGSTIPASNARRHQLTDAVDRIRAIHGDASILRGHDLLLREEKKPLPKKKKR